RIFMAGAALNDSVLLLAQSNQTALRRRRGDEARRRCPPPPCGEGQGVGVAPHRGAGRYRTPIAPAADICSSRSPCWRVSADPHARSRPTKRRGSPALYPLLPCRARLQLEPPAMQDRLGVAARLCATEEDQVAGRLEGDRLVEARRHRPVERIALVLQ